MLIDPATGQSPGWVPNTPTKIKAVTEYETAVAMWTEEDAIIKQQITITIPSSLYVELMSKDMSHKWYTTLKDKFKNWSLVIAQEKWQQLNELWLKEGRNIQVHFDKM